MARALTYSAKSMQRINRVVIEVEGAPLQAVRRRARWPIAGTSRTRRYVYIVGETVTAYFKSPNDTDTVLTCFENYDGTGREYEVHFSHQNGVVFTGQRILIEKLKSLDGQETWWEVAQCGVSVWPRAVSTTDIVTTGSVNLRFIGFSTGTAVFDLCEVGVQNFDPTFTIATDTVVYVSFEQDRGEFVVHAAACPETEE
jgi:hypothetical protein